MCLPCGLPITWWYLLRRSSRPSCARRKPVSTRGGLESFPFRVYRRNLICTYVAYRSIVRENTDGPRIHLFSVGCKIPVLETLPKSFFLNESPESSKQSSRLGLWTAESPTQRHSRPSVFFSILGSAKALRDRQQVRGSRIEFKIAADPLPIRGSDLHLREIRKNKLPPPFVGRNPNLLILPSIDLGTIGSAPKWTLRLKRLFAGADLQRA